MPHALTRGIAGLVALVALGAAGQAAAGNPAPASFSAPFESGGKISFELVRGQGERKVRAIEITDMAADCEGRAGEIDFTIFGSTPVLGDRSFAVRSEDATGGKAVVKGRFSRRFKRAAGIARLRGKFDVQDGRARCASGRQRFEAKASG
ncbi:MAG: hypothetical protein M3Y34_03265 [Actinomycetota bacterium]|nr:hypothetical protein [Actinomycetota bacterium]